MAKRDYYEVLGAARDVSLPDLKKAYRALAVRWHPDRNPGNKEAEERFKEAAEAYQVLSNPEQRARYDRFGHTGAGGASPGFNPEAFGDFSDILGSLFGDFFGGGRSRRGGARRGEDLHCALVIDLVDAVRGREATLEVPRTEGCARCGGSGGASPADVTKCADCGGAGQVRYTQGFFSVSRACPACRGQGRRITRPCPACGGEGRVRATRRLNLRVPAGVDTGSRLRLAGEGEGGQLGGPPGDLYVDIEIHEHPDYRRAGLELHCRLPVTFSQAALGATLRVPLLTGEQEDLSIPAGSQSGASFRIKGRGVPRLDGRGRGDLVVAIRIETPKRLTKKARELLRQLAEEEKAQVAGSGPFERVRDLPG